MRISLMTVLGLLLVGSTVNAQNDCFNDGDCEPEEMCVVLPCEEDDNCEGEGVCVAQEDPLYSECEVDSDCDENENCLVACMDCAPEDEDCFGGCFGECVEMDPEPEQECDTDTDCLDNEVCMIACTGCDPDDGEYCSDECFGECVEMDPRPEQECEIDADCSENESCQIVGGTACASACDGENCEPMPCEEEHFYACVPNPEPECETDADCGPGFACELSNEISISAEPGSSDGDWCDTDEYEDENCEQTSMPYPEEEFYECVPAECQTDADCGSDDLICFEFGWSSCAEMACTSDEECPEVECEEVTESYCAPAYIGPCEIDTDCGEGFTCETEEICQCSGNTEPAPEGEYDDGDHDDYDDERDYDEPNDRPEYSEDCTCTPSDEQYCAPIEQECETDDDCFDGWSCEFYMTLGDERGDSGSSEVPDSDPEEMPEYPGDEENMPEYPGDEEGFCAPPYSDYWAPGRGGYDESVESATNQDGDIGINMPTDPDPTDPTDLDDATRPSVDDEDAGCQVAPSSRTPLSALLGLLGFVAFRRRK